MSACSASHRKVCTEKIDLLYGTTWFRTTAEADAIRQRSSVSLLLRRCSCEKSAGAVSWPSILGVSIQFCRISRAQHSKCQVVHVDMIFSITFLLTQ